MNNRGFSLIELLIVIAIIGILSAITTFGFSQYLRKSGITNQTHQLYADLTEYRTKAIYEKVNWTFKISAGSYSIYPTSVTTGSPFKTVVLNYPVTTNNATDIIFDTQGTANVTSKSICVSETNDAPVNALVISTTRVQLGKKDGANCVASNITAK